MTRHVLLPLFDDVVMLEPVGKFLAEAKRSAAHGEWKDLPEDEKEETPKGKNNRGKRVWFVKGGLQSCDPRFPIKGGENEGVVGQARGENSGDDHFGGTSQMLYDS